jgi:prepilin-type processing-associated H-X9-DG protein
MNDFNNLAAGTFKQVSYLQPVGFALWSLQSTNAVRDYTKQDGTLYTRPTTGYAQFADPATINKGFVPRLTNIGIQLSDKVLAADGTRYWADDHLDFDVSPAPARFSSFSDTPSYHPSTAYGRASPNAANGENIKLTFRHSGAINAAFFDGSVRKLSADTTWRRVDYWYPSGSIFTGIDSTPESRQDFQTGKPLP